MPSFSFNFFLKYLKLHKMPFFLSSFIHPTVFWSQISQTSHINLKQLSVNFIPCTSSWHCGSYPGVMGFWCLLTYQSCEDKENLLLAISFHAVPCLTSLPPSHPLETASCLSHKRHRVHLDTIVFILQVRFRHFKLHKQYFYKKL